MATTESVSGCDGGAMEGRRLTAQRVGHGADRHRSVDTLSCRGVSLPDLRSYYCHRGQVVIKESRHRRDT